MSAIHDRVNQTNINTGERCAVVGAFCCGLQPSIETLCAVVAFRTAFHVDRLLERIHADRALVFEAHSFFEEIEPCTFKAIIVQDESEHVG